MAWLQPLLPELLVPSCRRTFRPPFRRRFFRTLSEYMASESAACGFLQNRIVSIGIGNERF